MDASRKDQGPPIYPKAELPSSVVRHREVSRLASALDPGQAIIAKLDLFPASTIMKDSQNTTQLAVGMNGQRGLGVATPMFNHSAG